MTKYYDYDKVRKIEQREDPRRGKETFPDWIIEEMDRRVENFKKAMKNPMKRLTPDPDVKHDAHMVDTQGFNPDIKISVNEDETIIEQGAIGPIPRTGGTSRPDAK